MQTLNLKSKSPPKVGSQISDERRFFELYKSVLQGLCAGTSFEVSDPDSNGSYRMDSKDELELLEHVAWLAYNGACYASNVYRKGRETAAFKQKL